MNMLPVHAGATRGMNMLPVHAAATRVSGAAAAVRGGDGAAWEGVLNELEEEEEKQKEMEGDEGNALEAEEEEGEEEGEGEGETEEAPTEDDKDKRDFRPRIGRRMAGKRGWLGRGAWAPSGNTCDFFGNLFLAREARDKASITSLMSGTGPEDENRTSAEEEAGTGVSENHRGRNIVQKRKIPPAAEDEREAGSKAKKGKKCKKNESSSSSSSSSSR
uniref:Uncharacterized protein n=1 Tax=Chromera velia CCMP2878 TaxID=1169474 RepID=A0A0G4GUJ1_9ALVE|eukprot:Cvel_23419.t1-p1 / transcript=Cvel_23419.t1 / gene=Cvel_23419 / organism=Chromera_velia_CCMP2878 / gene_product=hypothetical protein / transcript_product=hypothetical protein / location=Cvel_scaffold2412:16547-19371(-) / protein_length=217 / sequence_SO=supercontig / SO=protein_coding / is_pseudo=false